MEPYNSRRIAAAFVLLYVAFLTCGANASCAIEPLDFLDWQNATQGYAIGPNCRLANHATGQTFIAPVSALNASVVRLSGITWALFYEKAGTVDGLVTRLYEWSDVSPPGNLIWTSSPLSVTVPQSYAFVKPVFPVPSLNVTSGTKYLITLEWTAGVSTGCGHLVKRPTGTTYPFGVEVEELAGDWIARPGYESPCFKVDFESLSCAETTSNSLTSSQSSSSPVQVNFIVPLVVGVVVAIALVIGSAFIVRRYVVGSSGRRSLRALSQSDRNNSFENPVTASVTTRRLAWDDNDMDRLMITNNRPITSIRTTHTIRVMGVTAPP
mmetsp:Transcript_39332/g.63791  ORF Transcript_39332/g.63791 Transcript_39332/m.63791 type:complete len:324 (-) Transcript_39332:507-1478(-)|eukprot:CAMPEP_0184649506 /NCGR_PEP_ID=MMETSP0308-20130426/6903_1 /TAXON_ID=38269 /ORGANISM="Gloeochaete witrockiana, Strain SAG 46.84" /LENGTH=323 /DNA_ID=CAMNT_0027082309 /DNA_START=60 /DNA_END=1031 /DNA_ORIENTATION=+